MAGKHSKSIGLLKAFGKAVRFHRNKLGLSQENLADRAQLDRSYMSQIERGIKNATLNSIWRISQALEVAASELLRLTQELEANADSAPTELASRRQASRTGKTSRVVLVVDDDGDTCQSVSIMLKKAGFETRIATCGFDAIRIMASEAVHLVVSDVRMKNGNGFELLDAVRNHHPAVPVFFITGFDDLTLEDALQRGAVGLFNKPFDPTSFVTSVKGTLNAAGFN